MESVNRVETVYDPMRQGSRALDEKTRELVGKVGATENYDLVIRGHEYPYTEQNTPEDKMPEWVQTSDEGVHEKGRIPLAGVDTVEEDIDIFYDSISQFEGEKMEKIRRIGHSIENVNQNYGTDWSATLYLLPEKRVYNEPGKDFRSGVFYTPETQDLLRSSEAFADLSSGMFGGWLELSPEELLERQ